MPEAIRQGLATEAELDTIVGRSLGLRMRAGMFDPVADQPYTKIPVGMLGAASHHTLAEEVASQGLVLLQNPAGSTGAGAGAGAGAGVGAGAGAGGVLPLALSKKTAVIGPHAHADRQLLGSYFSVACPLPSRCPMKGPCPHGSATFHCKFPHSDQCMLDWSCATTPFAAIAAASSGATTSAAGCSDGVSCSDTSLFAEAIATAKAADQLVIVLGIDANIESEGHDRTNTTLPGMQEELALQLLALNKPTVVVLLNGGDSVQ